MLSKKKVVYLVVIILSSIIYITFFGTPWGKYMEKKEALEYLRNKYNKEFVLDSTIYDFKNGTYMFIIHEKNHDELAFKTFQTSGRWPFVRPSKTNSNEKYADNFFNVLWEYQLETELTPFIKKKFSDKFYCMVNITENPIYYDYTGSLTFIPSYNDIKSKFQKEHINLFIDIKDDNSWETEYKGILDLISFVIEKKYIFGTINFRVEKGNRKVVKFYLDYDEFMKVSNKEDLKKIINQQINNP